MARPGLFNTKVDGFVMHAQDELRSAVLLVFANKQDLPNAMTAAELTASPHHHHQENLLNVL